ncbi:hypothetical protein CLOP_g1781 [Closterium sp. NIES-67]|nr:hypothetical protein CLOP_g1781 [Closterium sp. NIES-67]
MNERGGDANGRGAVPEKPSEPPPSKVDALDGSNYEEWSGRMRSAFKRYKLLKIAVGEEKMPEEGEARERWIEKSAVLFDLILQSVNKEMFEHIKDLVEADDSGPRAWKLLRDVIQPNTLPMVIMLEKELAAISMRPGDDVKPVLDKIKDTYARMAAAGSSVSQLQQCTKIISVCRAKLGKKVLWSLEEETSCIKDLWQLPIIPWNGKTPTAATAAAAKATAGGDATAPTDGVLEAVKKLQQQQTHGEVALVKNRVLATVGDKEWIPYTKWYGSAPAVNMLRAFGCMVVFHVPKEKRGKLEASGRWGVHLGIAKDHKGWLLWDLTTQKLTVSRDVKFLESLYYKEWKQQQQKLPSTPLIVEADELQQPSRQVEVAVSEEEMSGVTEEGGAAEVEQQQQQQHESPSRVPHPPERPRRDVRPPVRLTYGGRGKPNVEKDEILMLLVYVDDILLFSASTALLDSAEQMLEMQFKCSKMGEVKYYLGMHVERDVEKGVLRLHQRKYLGLKYSGLRQRLQRGAADVKSGEMLLSCYTDASFNSVKADGTSIGGYVCLLGGGAVSWRSKKQNEVGLSSCETEYMALHHGAKEVVWLRRLLEELGVGQEEPTVVFNDNESAVKLAKNACLHGLTKHIRPKWHWVRRLLDKEVRLEIVKTHQQAADIFTKRLAEADHWKGMKLARMSVH